MSARPVAHDTAERVAEMVAGARAFDGWPIGADGNEISCAGPSPEARRRVAAIRDGLLALLAAGAPDAAPSHVLTDEERDKAGAAAFMADTGLPWATWEDLSPRARDRYRAIGGAAVEHVLRLRGGR